MIANSSNRKVSEMVTKPEQPTGATIIRGANGELFIIPDDDLEAFRVPDDVAAPAIQLLDKQKDVIGTPEKLTNGVVRLPSLQGPLARPTKIKGPTSPTVPDLRALRGLRKIQ
jgi:hypothetical protein